MFSPRPEPENSPPSHHDDSSGKQKEHAPDTAEMLDRIVDATAFSGGEQITPPELDALRAVAERHKADSPAPRLDELVARELIEAMLRVNYGRLNKTEGFYRSMAQQISAVLIEGPNSRKRLENLWLRLLEGVP